MAAVRLEHTLWAQKEEEEEEEGLPFIAHADDKRESAFVIQTLFTRFVSISQCTPFTFLNSINP